MRVLHFYKTYYPDSYGGIEQVIFQVVRGTAHLGVGASVLTLSPRLVDRHLSIDGHTVYRCYRNFKIASTDISLTAFWHFKKLVKQVDIIHYHFPWPLMDLIHIATNVNKPSLVTYHSDIIKQKRLLYLYKPLMKRFLGEVNAIVATSENYHVSSDVLQEFQHKVKVIPIGLDRKSYPSAEANRVNYWRSILGKKFFLFVGVLRYYKGLHILLNALSIRDYPTVIIGAGPIENELKAQASKLCIKNIKFLGQVSEEDKVAILSISYAIVFPSHLRSEAFGISLLEGAMYGKPMISSEIGTGTSFVNIAGETGFVVPPGSPTDFSLKMAELWNSPELALLMGKNAAERFESLFTADKMCRSYLSLYNQLLD
jgi:glycosyltransferase involved in cell wall biosynthesis